MERGTKKQFSMNCAIIVIMSNSFEKNYIENKPKEYPDVGQFMHNGIMDLSSWRQVLNEAPVEKYDPPTAENLGELINYLGGINKQLKDAILADTLVFLEAELVQYKSMRELSLDRNNSTATETQLLVAKLKDKSGKGEKITEDDMNTFLATMDIRQKSLNFRSIVPQAMIGNIAQVYKALKEIESEKEIIKLQELKLLK